MRKRQNRIEFYLDDKEFEKLNRAVQKSGLPRSTYFRHLVKDRIPQDRPPKDYFDLLEEMRVVSNYFRQIVGIAYATGNIDTDYYEKHRKELIDLYLKIFTAAQMPIEVDKL